MAHDIHARGMAKGYADGRAHIKKLIERNRKLPPPPRQSVPAPKPLSLPAPRKRPINDSGVIAQPSKSKLKVTLLEEDNSDIPLGQVRRKVGDVFLWEHDEYQVVRVSNCSATATSIIARSPRDIRISTCCDKQDVIRRETNFHSQKPSAEGINQKQTGTKENTAMVKAKTEKTGNVMTLIVGLAKAGKSEKDITKAVTSNYGTPSAATAYLIGREWRRVNKVGRHFGTGDAKPAKKAPAKKAAPVKAPKKSAPKAKAPKAGTPPPPRPAAQEEPTPEQESAPE